MISVLTVLTTLYANSLWTLTTSMPTALMAYARIANDCSRNLRLCGSLLYFLRVMLCSGDVNSLREIHAIISLTFLTFKEVMYGASGNELNQI